MKTLIVDDERLARNEMRRLLDGYADVEIVGEAANADEARTAIRDLSPELLFVDIQLPGETGFDLLASIGAAQRVVFTTAHDEHALRAFEFGAVDYLIKPIAPARLASTMSRLSAESRTPGSPRAAASGIPTTTERLRCLLREELCGGEPTLEHLAARLHMSARTLHRRLAEEGTAFRRVVAEVRRETAERHLRASRLAIGEIAFLLGFSEASAFHRAFKRWTGRRALDYRRAHAPDA
jgi:YesN/AraC family two-component response regulator